MISHQKKCFFIILQKRYAIPEGVNVIINIFYVLRRIQFEIIKMNIKTNRSNSYNITHIDISSICGFSVFLCYHIL